MKYSKELHEHALQRIHDQGEVISFGTPFVESLLEEISRLQAENKQYQNIFDIQKMTIERLQAERRWIPVSERLPEMYSPVLTMAKKAKYPRVLSREKETKDNWVWSLRQLSGYVAYINQKTVTHWMPLPPPPEDE